MWKLEKAVSLLTFWILPQNNIKYKGWEEMRGVTDKYCQIKSNLGSYRPSLHHMQVFWFGQIFEGSTADIENRVNKDRTYQIGLLNGWPGLEFEHLFWESKYLSERYILFLTILFFQYLPRQSYLEDQSDTGFKTQSYNNFYISCDKWCLSFMRKTIT